MVDDFVAMAQSAEREMRSVFPETPLMRNDHLSEKHGADIWLKREDLSPVRSYKLRGAFNAMRKVIDTQGTFVCASAGNHAQGVAFMCRHFAVKGICFHACHDASAKNPKDSDVWRPVCRDQIDRRLL